MLESVIASPPAPPKIWGTLGDGRVIPELARLECTRLSFYTSRHVYVKFSDLINLARCPFRRVFLYMYITFIYTDQSPRVDGYQ